MVRIKAGSLTPDEFGRVSFKLRKKDRVIWNRETITELLKEFKKENETEDEELKRILEEYKAMRKGIIIYDYTRNKSQFDDDLEEK